MAGHRRSGVWRASVRPQIKAGQGAAPHYGRLDRFGRPVEEPRPRLGLPTRASPRRRCHRTRPRCGVARCASDRGGCSNPRDHPPESLTVRDSSRHRFGSLSRCRSYVAVTSQLRRRHGGGMAEAWRRHGGGMAQIRRSFGAGISQLRRSYVAVRGAGSRAARWPGAPRRRTEGRPQRFTAPWATLPCGGRPRPRAP